jgi:hypothetical protein
MVASGDRTLVQARGFDRLSLRDRERDVRLALRGHGIAFAPTGGGALRITVAQHQIRTRPTITQCRGTTIATRPSGSGAVRYP